MPKVIGNITVERNVERTEPGPYTATSYTVRCGDRWEDRLTKGEAMEMLAEWLFGSSPQLRYLQTAERHSKRAKRHGHFDDNGDFVPPAEDTQPPATAGKD